MLRLVFRQECPVWSQPPNQRYLRQVFLPGVLLAYRLSVRVVLHLGLHRLNLVERLQVHRQSCLPALQVVILAQDLARSPLLNRLVSHHPPLLLSQRLFLVGVLLGTPQLLRLHNRQVNQPQHRRVHQQLSLLHSRRENLHLNHLVPPLATLLLYLVLYQVIAPPLVHL